MVRLNVAAVVAPPVISLNAAVSVSLVAALAVIPCRPAPLIAAALANAEPAPWKGVAPTKLAVGATVTVDVPSLKVTVEVLVNATPGAALVPTAVPVAVE